MKRSMTPHESKFAAQAGELIDRAVNEGIALIRRIATVGDDEILQFILTLTADERRLINILMAIEVTGEVPAIDDHADEFSH